MSRGTGDTGRQAQNIDAHAGFETGRRHKLFCSVRSQLLDAMLHYSRTAHK